jgi:hypothetical protein
VALFLAITGRTYWLVVTGQIDNTYDCGCFGVFLKRTATEAFWQDLFLLVPPLVMCFVARGAETKWPSWRFWVGVLSGILVVVYTVVTAGMPSEEMSAVEETAAESAPFVLTQDYALVIGDEEDTTAQIFQSDTALQMIVFSNRIPGPLILDLRKNLIFGVSSEMIDRRGKDSLDLPSLSGAKELGVFQVGSGGLSLSLDDQKIEIRGR